MPVAIESARAGIGSGNKVPKKLSFIVMEKGGTMLDRKRVLADSAAGATVNDLAGFGNVKM